MARDLFVGRGSELARIAGLMAADRGSLLLVDAEPGMGKTALADEAVGRAQAEGWTTLWGGCPESEGAPPYWPWIQILRALGGREGVLAEAGPDDNRFAMFDRVIGELRRAEPVLVVLDDLHWADPASLRLLQVLSAGLDGHRMLVLGLHRRGAGGEILTSIGRERSVHRLTLGGLSQAEVERLAFGRTPDRGLVRSVVERCEGNPFFALELLRLSRDSGELPGELRQVIGRRLDAASEPARRLLRAASVLGREFTLARLAELVGEHEEALLDRLDEAAGRELIREAGIHRFRFAHALTCEAAYAELGLAERRRLHGRAADGAEGVDTLAHHLRQAGSPDAIQVTLKAAEQSRARLAYEHAAFQLGQALRLMPESPQRLEALLELARCEFRSGAVSAAWRSCREAADLARSLGDAAAMADAAIVVRGLSNSSAEPVCPEINALCRQVLAVLPSHETVRRAKVLAQQAITANAFTHDGSTELSGQAIELAEACGDADARFLAMQARQVELTHPRHVLERLDNGTRALALGRSAGRDEYLLWGHAWRLDAFWELGRRHELDLELDRFTEVAVTLREPLETWRVTMIRACLAEIEGRFDDAEALMDQALVIGRRGGHEGADFVHMVVTSRIARLTGRHAAEMERAVREFTLRAPPGAGTWLALQLLAAGRAEEAEAAFREGLPAVGFFPSHAPEWMPALAGIVSLCAAFDEAAPARRLYDDLLPYADREIVSGAVTGSEGPISYYLGLLANLLGEHATARGHLLFAVERSLGMRSPVWEAMARLELGKALLAGRDHGYLRASDEQFAKAAELAGRLGLKPVLAKLATVARPHGPVLSAREEQVAELVAEGMRNRQIGERLFLSERTIETHVRNIMIKLALETRGQIAKWWAESRERGR
ncbi:ATP-binding protein [Nonomuraea sp. NPDC050663]|uniref:ATP-binding protein n=1 Tax=Nonomuraea sp. NPDC050663 TaxID=3364370 RepID=UPI0037BC4BCF